MRLVSTLVATARVFALGVAMAFGVIPISAATEEDGFVVLETTGDAKLDEILREGLTLPLLLRRSDQAISDLATEIDAEVLRLTQLLKAQGYLDARMSVEGAGSAEDPLRLIPRTGPIFSIGWIRLNGLEDAVLSNAAPAIRSVIKKHTGETATSKTLDALREGVRSELRNASFGKAIVPVPDLVPDIVTATAGVRFDIDAGRPLKMGRTHFEGSFRLTDVSAGKLVPYELGDAYSPQLIEQLREALKETGLVRRIRISLSERPDEAGFTDIFVKLTDRPADMAELERSSGSGPTLLILTMLTLLLMEAVRVTPLWHRTGVRRVLRIMAFFMVGASAPIVADRVMSFLS